MSLHDGIARWRKHIVEIVENEHTQQSLALALGVHANTVNNWVRPTHPMNGPPGLDHMLRLHRLGVYPIAEQMMDLGDLSREELQPVVPVWHPKVSLATLMEQFTDLVADATKAEPDALDFTRTLLNSCHASGDIGRWRTRVFDIVHGWHMPHLGGQGVEFLRWYGPNALTDRNPDRTREYLAALPGPTDYWKNHIGKRIKEPTPPDSFRPDVIDPAQRQQRWTAFQLERFELVARIIENLKASQGGFYGGYGPDGTALLRHDLAPSARHLLTLPPPIPVPDLGGRMRLDREDIRLIVVIGPSSLAPGRAATRLAQAIGWRYVSNRTLAHSLTGHRVTINNHTTSGDREVLRYLAALPASAPPLVVSCHHSYLAEPERPSTERPIPLPETSLLFNTPGVLPIVLSHEDDNRSSQLWEQRVAYGKGHSEVSPMSREEHARRSIDAWNDFFSDVPGAYLAEIKPTLLNGGAPVGEDATHPARWFAHPANGDTMLRIVYELGCALRRGRPVTAAGARLGFAASSLVDTYRELLGDITSGDYWADPDDWLTYDPTYLSSPANGTRPRRARTVKLTII